MNNFVISDTHFGHANCLNFVVHATDCKYYLKKVSKDFIPDCLCPKMRPGFSCVEEMNEHMVNCWNRVVGKNDKVYHLGDVGFGKKNIAILDRCNGLKNLLRGNHDGESDNVYRRHFKSIYATRELSHFILSHIPLHPGSVKQGLTNVHGHLHNNVPALHLGVNYLNVSVEMIDYTPQSLEDLDVLDRKQREENQRAVDANLKRLGIAPWTEGIEDLLL